MVGDAFPTKGGDMLRMAGDPFPTKGGGMLRMAGDPFPTKGGDMLRMVGDPWTIVCLSIKVIAQLRLIYNDEIHFCFYI